MELEDLLQLWPCPPSTFSPGWVADELTRRGKLLVLWDEIQSSRVAKNNS
jgi:hypothetical protein